MRPNPSPPPQHWWNEHKHPTIALGPLAFPADILPYTLAFAFIFWKTYPGPRRRGPANDQQEEIPPAVPEELQQNNRDNPPAAAPDLERRAGQALTFFHNVLTMRALWATSVHHPDKIDSIVPDLGTLCLVEAAALLLGGLAFGERGSGLPCTLTSLGWIVFRYSDYEAQLDLILVAALAAPCVWKLCGPIGFGGRASGLLLLISAIDAAVPMDAELRAWTTNWNVEWWRCGVVFVPLALESLYNTLTNPPERGRQDWSGYLAYLADEMISASENMGHGVVRVLVFIAMLAASACCTGALNACLPWKHLIFGLPSKSPLEMGLAMIFGGFLYVIPWALMMHFCRGPMPPLDRLEVTEIVRRETPIFVEAIA